MILFAATTLSGRESGEIAAALRAAMPCEAVTTLDDPYDPAAVEYAVTWRAPHGLLATLPRLAAVFNLGAGVDALLADPTLPHVPIVRFVDPDLSLRMGEYVTLQVLAHHRRMLPYLAQQRERRWAEIVTPAASDVTVGILGYGTLGEHCAGILRAVGFDVIGYARSPRGGAVPLYNGDGRATFLAETDILVALLPLTAETRGIVDADMLKRLRRSPYGPILVNAGRGGLAVQEDVIAALEDGTLRGASLDVFDVEPLPADSPLWGMENVVVTPHVAAVTSADALARSVAAGIAAHRAGEALGNVVARDRGY